VGGEEGRMVGGAEGGQVRGVGEVYILALRKEKTRCDKHLKSHFLLV